MVCGDAEFLMLEMVDFLRRIGLVVQFGETGETTFLPGLEICAGILMVDEKKLLHPGDLLHEAGHLAVLPAEQRGRAQDHVGDDAGLEMAAIAWSYAAARHLGIAPEVVFHEAGYRGGGDSILENFAAGRYFGVPILEWCGMTGGTGAPYPAMRKWLRD
jgi:hypothetical protein